MKITRRAETVQGREKETAEVRKSARARAEGRTEINEGKGDGHEHEIFESRDTVTPVTQAEV